jgi:hypothetical protein
VAHTRLSRELNRQIVDVLRHVIAYFGPEPTIETITEALRHLLGDPWSDFMIARARYFVDNPEARNVFDAMISAQLSPGTSRFLAGLLHTLCKDICIMLTDVRPRRTSIATLIDTVMATSLPAHRRQAPARASRQAQPQTQASNQDWSYAVDLVAHTLRVRLSRELNRQIVDVLRHVIVYFGSEPTIETITEALRDLDQAPAIITAAQRYMGGSREINVFQRMVSFRIAPGTRRFLAEVVLQICGNIVKTIRDYNASFSDEYTIADYSRTLAYDRRFSTLINAVMATPLSAQSHQQPQQQSQQPSVAGGFSRKAYQRAYKQLERDLRTTEPAGSTYYERTSVKLDPDNLVTPSGLLSVARIISILNEQRQLPNFTITGEPGVDSGGVTRRVIQTLCDFVKAQLHSTVVGPAGPTQQPAAGSACNLTTLYTLASADPMQVSSCLSSIIVLASRTGNKLDLPLTLGARALLVYGDQPPLDDVYYNYALYEQQAPDEAKALYNLTTLPEQQVEEYLSSYPQQGIQQAATKANRLRWLNAVLKKRLYYPSGDPAERQLAIDLHAALKNLLTPQELKYLFNLFEIDLTKLKVEGDFAKGASWLSRYIQELTPIQLRRLVLFIHGAVSNKPIKVNHSYRSPSHLPVAHTCFGSVDLPDYPDYATFKSKLETALAETDARLYLA